jgi:undecaprenyl-diphosphatase
LLAWAVLVALLIGIGEIVVRSSAAAAFDRHITSMVVAHRSAGLDAAMKAITWLGSWVALVAAGVLLAILAAIRRVPVLAVILAVLFWAGESSGVTLTKNLVQRARPPQAIWLVTAHGWSWTSGHAGAAGVVFAVLALTVCYLTARRPIRVAVWGAAAVAVAAVGFSRIELGVHWTTDVIASVVFVGLWLAITVAVWAAIVTDRPADAGSPQASASSNLPAV